MHLLVELDKEIINVDRIIKGQLAKERDGLYDHFRAIIEVVRS